MYTLTLLIPSSVDGHLDVLLLLTLVNNDAMSKGVQIPDFLLSLLLSIYNSISNCLRNHHAVLRSSCTFSILFRNAPVFQFLCILTSTCCFLLLKLIVILMDVIFKSIIFDSFLLKTFVPCGFQNSTMYFFLPCPPFILTLLCSILFFFLI